MKTYFNDGKLKIRSMMPEDAKILYDTYLSYGWHPQLEIYEDYYKEQEAGGRERKEQHDRQQGPENVPGRDG
jgi:hypothetical protein